MKKALALIFVALFMAIGFVGNASADNFKFTGEGWITRDEGTNEYYLVINKGDIDPNKIIMEKLRFMSEQTERDFFGLTPITDDAGSMWKQLDPNAGKIGQWNRKATKKSRKHIQKGKLDEVDQMDWIDKFVTEKLAGRLFKVVFKDLDGNKWIAKLGYGTNANPFPYNEEGGPKGAASVPEPATLFLIASGLLGIGAISRFKKRTAPLS